MTVPIPCPWGDCITVIARNMEARQNRGAEVQAAYEQRKAAREKEMREVVERLALRIWE